MIDSTFSKAFVILRGLLYSGGFVALWAWLAISVQRYDKLVPIYLPDWLRPLGLLLALAGAVLAGWCIATFLTRGRGTPAPFDPPRRFVASGPYQYVRNPMYVGAFWILLGAGLALSSLAIAGLSFVFLFLMNTLVLLYEEPTLAAKFGDDYVHYKAHVNRWLPVLNHAR